MKLDALGQATMLSHNWNDLLWCHGHATAQSETANVCQLHVGGRAVRVDFARVAIMLRAELLAHRQALIAFGVDASDLVLPWERAPVEELAQEAGEIAASNSVTGGQDFQPELLDKHALPDNTPGVIYQPDSTVPGGKLYWRGINEGLTPVRSDAVLYSFREYRERTGVMQTVFFEAEPEDIAQNFREALIEGKALPEAGD